MVKEYTHMPMEMYIWEIGNLIKKRVLEKYFGGNNNKNIEDIGETIFQKESENKNGMKIQEN